MKDDENKQLGMFGEEDNTVKGDFKWKDDKKEEVVFVPAPTGKFNVAKLRNNPRSMLHFIAGVDPVNSEEEKPWKERLAHPELIDEMLEVAQYYGRGSFKKNGKLYIAIDPGKSGAVVGLSEKGEVIFKEEMPLFNDELDAIKLNEIISAANKEWDCVLIVEDVHSIFGVSASNNFVFGWVCGQIDAVVKLSKIKHHYLQPKFWQKNIWTNVDMVYKPLKTGQKKPSVDTKPTSLNAVTRLFPNEDLRGHIEVKFYGNTAENRKQNRVGHEIPTKKNKANDGLVDALLLAECARRLNY